MIIILGVPGVGKSTVIKPLAQEKGYRMLNYGDMMFEIASKGYGVDHRDKIRALPKEKQSEIQEKVGLALAKETGKVILDTHCSIQTPQGYLPGLPRKLLEKLPVTGLVYVSAPVEEIIERRKKDFEATGRIRPTKPEDIREHEEVNRQLLSAYSFFCGVPAMIIENRNGRIEEARAKVAAIL
ncbi:MAG: adenylate kinase [Candidatus Micrarchaeia archaeon]